MSAFDHLSIFAVGVPVTRTMFLEDGQAMFKPALSGIAERLYVPIHDKSGHFHRLPGEHWPLYTRHSLGMSEMARARRRRRKARS